MTRRGVAAAVLLLLLGAAAAPSQPPAPILPPGDKEPLLRVDAGGPTSYVTALAFSRDGQRLYVAGWDKVVHVWARGPGGRFAPEPTAYRVPIGPDSSGAINALALSEDGTWLAVAGAGPFRGQAGFRQDGVIYATALALDDEMRQDVGLIYLFNTQTGAVRLLRGHRGGDVRSLAFAPPRAGKPLLLASAAKEWFARANRYEGTVCLWDADKGELLDWIRNLPAPDAFTARPGLAVWHSGPAVREVRIAFGWGDGTFRAWHCEDGREGLRTGKDLLDSITAAYDPGANRVVTAVYGAGGARLRTWDAVAQSRPTAPAEGADTFPRALALVSSRADGKFDYAAVANRRRNNAYRLQILDVGAGGKVRADVPLWQGNPRQPVLAAAPQGRHLAVAGGDDHEVRVYAVADLLKGQAQPQVLRGAGTAVRYAAFVKKGDERGLLLSESGGKEPGEAPRAPAAGDLIFDLGKRVLNGDRAGWALDAPAAGGWRAEGLTDGPGVAVYRGDTRVRTVRPSKEQGGSDWEVTDWALLPPGRGRLEPILALAGHLNGQPRLVVFNAETGKEVRQLTGHVERISSLAFSGDGRLLVSAGEDRTVCVWSLTSLDRVLGRFGRLSGVAVAGGDGGGVVVRGVRKDGPAAGLLREKERIEGIIPVGKQLRALASPAEYHEAISALKPGAQVTLRVRGEKGPRDVILPVDQGIDERKPLLSLFLTGGGKAQERDWIGWSPMGPYDCSGAGAERYLGWHFNTGDAAAPTRFALAGEYRKQYYREGLLKDLVAHGELRVAERPRPPPPQMGLLIEDNGRFPEPDARSQILVRNPKATLHVDVVGRPRNTLEALTWQIDDGPKQELPLDSAAGEELSLKRGVHRVRVTARAPDTEPQEVSRELTVRYQPPAPSIAAPMIKSPLVVKEPGFTPGGVVVRPGLPGEAVTVHLTHQHGGAVLARRKYALVEGKPPALEPLTLKPGYNLIEMVAVNRDALPGDEAAESTRLPLEVTLIEKAPPPLIALAILPGADEAGKLAVEPGQRVVVHAGRVRLLGQVKAASEDLARVEWAEGKAGKAASATGFVAGKGNEFTVREDVADLKPGAHTFRFLARTATSDVAERELTLFYQPPLPRVLVVAPGDGETIADEKDLDTYKVEARLIPTGDPHPYKAEVLVSGQDAVAAALNERDDALTARVPLKPGSNRLQVRLSNAWDAVVLSEPVTVRYVRPPTVGALENVTKGEGPLHDFRAEVESPLQLRSQVVVVVNGKERPAEASVEAGPKKGAWVVTVKGVALEEGSNEVSLRLSNEEAECRAPGRTTVKYTPVKPVPVITFLDPRPDAVAPARRLTVRVRVHSESPLASVRLLLNGTPLRSVDPPDLKLDADGNYVLTAEAALAAGENKLRVEARNAGGPASADQVATYPRRPVRVAIDRLSVRGKPFEPQRREPDRRTPVFAAMPSGRVALEGRVLWDEEDDDRLTKAAVVRVFVNGFQQLSAALEKPAAPGLRERTFRANLLLNQDKDNRIELALPGLEQEAATCTSFFVDCNKPERAQRLHLLLLSVQEKDGSALRARFLQALGAGPGDEGPLRTAAFSSVQVYDPLVGNQVRRENVDRLLSEVRARIRASSAPGEPHLDVVVFYYQGEESLGANGNLLHMSVWRGRRGSLQEPLTCDDLARAFADTPGAYVLLFDVARPEGPAAAGRDKVARWDDNFPDVKTHVSVLRYAFLGPAAPPAPSLVQALHDIIPKEIRLDKVVELVGRSATAAPGARPQFDKYVSDSMGSMTIGGGSKK
jgi:WD40 repeat protein